MPLRPTWLAICASAACATATAERPVPPPPVPVVAAVVAPPIAPPPDAPAPAVVTLPPCPASPRDKTQLPDHVVELVGLTDAMTVVDLGSGDGYFLCRLSRAVPRGRVIATEVSRSLVRGLDRRVTREQLSNVETVQAPRHDVGFARADRILLVNVWHHLPGRKRYAARIARALAPGGKVIVVDFERRPRGGHGIAPAQVIAELAAAGIDAALVAEELPGQYVIVGSVRAGR